MGGLFNLKKIKNHFLICGWKNNYEHIIDGVIAANPGIPLELIVLVNNATEDKMERIKTDSRFQGIKYLSGDFTDEATLLRANIKTAERILVLSDYSENFSQLEIDSRTVLAVLTIENLNPRMYIAAELIDAKFEKHLSLAHCDEIILSTDYERNLLVSASSGQGLSHVLRDLISEESGEGLFIKEIEPQFIGMTYKSYRRTLSGRAVLIGLLENTGNFYQRRREALAEAQKNPNIQKTVQNLKKIKELRSNDPVITPPDDYIIGTNTRAIFVHGRSLASQRIEDNAQLANISAIKKITDEVS